MQPDRFRVATRAALSPPDVMNGKGVDGKGKGITNLELRRREPGITPMLFLPSRWLPPRGSPEIHYSELRASFGGTLGRFGLLKEPLTPAICLVRLRSS